MMGVSGVMLFPLPSAIPAGHSPLFAVGAWPPHDGARKARRVNLSRDLRSILSDSQPRCTCPFEQFRLARHELILQRPKAAVPATRHCLQLVAQCRHTRAIDDWYNDALLHDQVIHLDVKRRAFDRVERSFAFVVQALPDDLLAQIIRQRDRCGRGPFLKRPLIVVAPCLSLAAPTQAHDRSPLSHRAHPGPLPPRPALSSPRD